MCCAGCVLADADGSRMPPDGGWWRGCAGNLLTTTILEVDDDVRNEIMAMAASDNSSSAYDVHYVVTQHVCEELAMLAMNSVLCYVPSDCGSYDLTNIMVFFDFFHAITTHKAENDGRKVY